jgi:hypothetical protein
MSETGKRNAACVNRATVNMASKCVFQLLYLHIARKMPLFQIVSRNNEALVLRTKMSCPFLEVVINQIQN